MERLEEKSVYQIVAQVTPAGGTGTASVGVKPTGLDVSFDDGQVLHYDLEGRLARVATPNVQWRRGLSHRVVRLKKRSREAGGRLESQVLDLAEADRVVEAASARLVSLRDAMRSGRVVPHRHRPDDGQSLQELQSLVERAAAFNAAAAREDLARFRSLYGDIPILPPDQYGALVLLATQGCAYNQCTFCGFYQGMAFHRKSPREFDSHLCQAMEYHGAGLAARRGVFLGQANALAGPGAWREEILEIVNREFQFPAPDERVLASSRWQGSIRRFEGISSFLDAFTGVRIQHEEFAALRRQNLRRLYLGVETGDRELLDWLEKPADPEAILETVTSARRGGLHVGVIILVGVGGERYFASHIKHTIRLLSEMPLGRGDYVYLSPLVVAGGSPYEARALAEHVEPLSAARLAEQENLLRAGLASAFRNDRPYVAHYDVSHFVY